MGKMGRVQTQSYISIVHFWFPRQKGNKKESEMDIRMRIDTFKNWSLVCYVQIIVFKKLFLISNF